jgi:hypothetical protein
MKKKGFYPEILEGAIRNFFEGPTVHQSEPDDGGFRIWLGIFSFQFGILCISFI